MDLAPRLSMELFMRIEAERQPTEPTRQLWRVLHDVQIYGHARQEVLDRGKTLPEVHQLHPPHFIRLTRALQILWKEINPLLTGREWRQLASCHRAFTNNNGYDCAEPAQHGPFADYINGRDLGAANPKIESLVCGGAIASGVEAVERGERVLWLDTINPQNVPDAADILAARWLFFEAVSVRPDGGVQSFSITAHAEYVPLIASQPVYIELEKVVKI